MVNTCTPMADSCQCMAKTTQYCKVNSLQLKYVLLVPSPPAFNLSQHPGLYQGVSSSHQWAKDWSFSFSISPFNEYSGLISLGLTGLIFLLSKGLSRVFSSTTIQKYQFFGTQPFFMVQLSHPHMTTGKTRALTIWKFVSKVMSLLFKILSRFVIAFLLRRKHLLILWLKSLSTGFWNPRK